MYEVKWLIQGRVILLDTGSHVTMEDNVAFNEEIETMLNTVDSSVHLISDTSQLKVFPVNVIKLIEVFTFLKHPNMGIGVQVSSNPMIRFLTRAITRVFTAYPFQIVASRDEAIELLYQLDNTLAVRANVD